MEQDDMWGTNTAELPAVRAHMPLCLLVWSGAVYENV